MKIPVELVMVFKVYWKLPTPPFAWKVAEPSLAPEQLSFVCEIKLTWMAEGSIMSTVMVSSHPRSSIVEIAYCPAERFVNVLLELFGEPLIE